MTPETKPSAFTLFCDMHSGGGTKEEPFDEIIIEAPEDEARVIFYNRFGHSPDRVSCTCCGEDYSVSSEPTIEQLTGYHRNCAYEGKEYVEKHNGKSYSGPHVTVEEYAAREDVLFIPASEIKPEEREGDVPTSGYVWVD